MAELASRARVLVVEDNVLLLRILTRELGEGFDVSAAASYAEALSLLDAGLEPHAVVSDLHLGAGPSGIDLLWELRRRHPACVRILLSGTASPGELAKATTDGTIQWFVAKPWQAASLRLVVQGALSAS